MLSYLMLLKRSIVYIMVNCSIYCYQDIRKCIVRLIFDTNIRQKTCVIWNSVNLDLCKTCNGVKQGGVHSEVLFVCILTHY